MTIHLMLRNTQSLVGAILLCGVASLPGCGSKVAHPDYCQVAGTVTLDNQPISEGLVTLMPHKGEGSNTSTGRIDSNGRFRLSTHTQGDGVPPGIYDVAITAWEVYPGSDDDGKFIPGVPMIPEKYMSPQTSGLSMTVDRTSKQTVELKLLSR